jgi:hypothetical protein
MGLDVLEIGMVGSSLSQDLRYFTSKPVRQARDTSTSDVDAYIHHLEERGKIEMFRRELSLYACLLAEGEQIFSFIPLFFCSCAFPFLSVILFSR